MSFRRVLLPVLFFSIVSYIPITYAAPLGCAIFSSPVVLKPGLVNSNVYFLQKFLNADPATRVAASGPGSSGKEITRYGPATAAAVSRFQEKYASTILAPAGLVRGTGVVGQATRRKMAALYCSAASSSVPTPTTTPVPATTPTVTLVANPSSVLSGGTSLISWSSTGATSCTTPWGSIATSGIYTTPALTTPTSYTVTCLGAGGSKSSSLSIGVGTNPPPQPSDPPTVTVTANPSSVNSGDSSTLTWSSTNATNCTASGSWSGSEPTSGSQVLSNLITTGTYTLTCTGSNGSASHSATITVNSAPAPTVAISANPSTISSGGSSTLTWSSTNATSCTASGGWSGTEATSGSQIISNITNSSTYTLTCTGSGGVGSANTTVTVNAQGGGGTNIVQFTLVSSTSGTKPFTLGHAFRIGDVPAGHYVTSDYGTLQVIPKNYWPDGSLKFAILSGTAALTAGQTKAITLSQNTTPPSGTALTTANLKATGITASIGAGSFGTVNWTTTDWDSPFSTWVSGPHMSSWIYRKPVGSDPSLVAWLEVRLYEDGNVEVLPWIENGYLLVPNPTNKSATYTFTLGGTQRFNQAINLLHHQRTPLVSGTALSYWLSGTNPDVTPHVDTAYLQNTELVPSYRSSLPTNSNLVSGSRGVVTSFTPLQQGNFNYDGDDMAQSGFQYPIGLITTYDALYLVVQPGVEKQLYNEVIWNGYSAGRYPIHYRDETTNLVFKPSQYPNLVISDGSGFKDNGSSETGQYTPTPNTANGAPPGWDHAHHPSVGYMAYLLSGQYYFMEETQFAATVNDLGVTDIHRGFGQSLFTTALGSIQTRAAAWDIRTLAQAAAIAPDGSAYRTERVQSVINNIAYYNSVYYAQPNNTQGTINPGEEDSSPNGSFAGSPWQQDFSIGAWGYLQALNITGLSSSDRTKLSQFFNWHAQFVIGRLGTFADSPYNNADAYDYALSPSNSGVDWMGGKGPWYTSFASAYQASLPLNGANGIPSWGATSDDHLLHSYLATDSMRSYWGNIQPAIAYAVRFNAPGAVAAYNRMTSANGTVTDQNAHQQTWSNPADSYSVLAQCNNAALVWCIRPLNEPVNNLPSVTLSATPTTVTSGGSSTLTWSSTNATSCTASGSWSGSKPTSGSQTMNNLTTTGTYTLTCSGAGGSNSNTVVVTVTTPAPTVTISANPSTVTSGGSSTLTWSSTNATSCTASGSWSGSEPTSGSQTMNNLTTTGTYTLTCTNAGGNGSNSTTIVVTANGQPSWRAGDPLNQWTTVTTNTLRGSGMTTNLSYSGMAYDPVSHTIYIAAAGGHTDSADNSVVAMNVFTNAPIWSQLHAISASYQPDVAHYTDGRPSSRHLYNSESFYNGKIYTIGARYVYGGGLTFPSVDAFSVANSDWLSAGTLPDLPSGYGYGEVLDRARGVVYTDGLGRYRLSDGFADKPFTDNTNLEKRFPFALDTVTDRLFVLEYGDGQGYDLNYGISASVVPLSGAGANTFAAVTWDSSSATALADFASLIPRYAGMGYDARNHTYNFVSRETLAQGKMFVITPTSDNTNWHMAEVMVPALNLNADGVYNRWFYDYDLGGFFLLPSTTDGLLFMATS